MTRATVYLAGPIAHTKDDKAFEWRDEVGTWLVDLGYNILSPLRGKHLLKGVAIGGDMKQYQSYGPFYESAGIMARDHFDVCRADVLFVNLLGHHRTTGTIMEMAWAYHMRKPMIVAIEDEGNGHDMHPMIAECLTFRSNSLDGAVSMLDMVVGGIVR